MTMDRSLKDRSSLTGRRSVLTRAERIAKMQEEGRFDPEQDSPFGLPKFRTIRSKAGSKAKKDPKDEDEDAPATDAS